MSAVRTDAQFTPLFSKYPTMIRAKKTAVVFLALGCNIVITVLPRSVKGSTPKASEEAPAEYEEETNEGTSSWIEKDQIEDLVEEARSSDKKTSASTAKKKTTAGPAKKDGVSLTFTMAHGDSLVFLGDDFEVRFSFLER